MTASGSLVQAGSGSGRLAWGLRSNSPGAARLQSPASRQRRTSLEVPSTASPPGSGRLRRASVDYATPTPGADPCPANGKRSAWAAEAAMPAQPQDGVLSTFTASDKLRATPVGMAVQPQVQAGGHTVIIKACHSVCDDTARVPGPVPGLNALSNSGRLSARPSTPDAAVLSKGIANGSAAPPAGAGPSIHPSGTQATDATLSPSGLSFSSKPRRNSIVPMDKEGQALIKQIESLEKFYGITGDGSPMAMKVRARHCWPSSGLLLLLNVHTFERLVMVTLSWVTRPALHFCLCSR